MMNEGAVVDATIINAPSSTKNQKKQRDPGMRQTKKELHHEHDTQHLET